MTDQPIKEFGKRRPAPIPAAPPVKRSGHVALLVMGTLAVGGGAFALMPRGTCEPASPGMAAPQRPGADCTSRGSTSSGGRGGGGWSSRSSFFSGGSQAGSSSSATASDSSSGNVTRGGFGSFARAFTAHFSGGG